MLQNQEPGTRGQERKSTSSLQLSRDGTIVLPAAGGALLAVPFIDFSLYPLAWVALVPFLWRVTQVRTYRAAALAGLLAGLAGLVPAFWWLVYTISVFGGFPTPIALFFYLCLSLYSAGLFVLFALGVHRAGFGVLGFNAPVLWVSLEFLYPNLFPWRVGHTQFHVPVLTQVGDLTGPYGLSFVMVWFSAGVMLCLRSRRAWPALAAAVAAVGMVVVYGLLRMPTIQAAIDAAPVVRVGMVQANVSIHEKEKVALFDVNVDRYRRLSAPMETRLDLLIWPESVAQWWVATNARQLAAKDHPYPGLQTHLIYGGLAYTPHRDPTGKERADKYNSAFLIDPSGAVLGRYDKQVLLPFGEFMPGATWFPQLAAMSPQTGDFSAGVHAVTLDVPGKVRVAPLICYEDLPAGIARGMTQIGAEALLTIFNDAWFGSSVAPYQHEALALFRAIENRRYFMRVGNAGVTGVIDPLGRVVARLGQFTEEVLETEIRPLRLSTFYTRHGDVFGWAVVAVALFLVLRRRHPL
jgi:apolipoprotein N-acyltransferase